VKRMKLIVVLIVVAGVVLLAGCPPMRTAILILQNDSSETIMGFYCTRSTNQSWGDNLLGLNSITSGGSHEFVIPSGTVDCEADGTSHYWQSWEVPVTTGETYGWTIIDANVTGIY
jgi:hypothetical protein